MGVGAIFAFFAAGAVAGAEDIDANAAAAAAADEPAAAGGAAVGATVMRTGAFFCSTPPTGAGVTRVARTPFGRVQAS